MQALRPSHIIALVNIAHKHSLLLFFPLLLPSTFPSPTSPLVYLLLLSLPSFLPSLPPSLRFSLPPPLFLPTFPSLPPLPSLLPFSFSDTTSVQNASLIFYETNILMTCTFATRTPALGCVITLAISNASTPEQFFISRNETGSRQCNTTLNRENAYTITEAVDWESDGSEGSFPIPIEPRDLEDPNNFTAITQCPLPEPPGILLHVPPCQDPTHRGKGLNCYRGPNLSPCRRAETCIMPPCFQNLSYTLVRALTHSHKNYS